MRKDWNPHDYIPVVGRQELFYALGGQDWHPEQSKLSEVARTAMLQNLLTEDNLPSYHREIAMNFTMDGPVGLLGQPLDRRGEPARDRPARLPRWSPAPSTPSNSKSCASSRSPAASPPARTSRGDTCSPTALFDSVIYVTFQELATRVSHRNTGKACEETIADQLLQRVSADENLHMIFYRDVSAAGLDMVPNQAMKSLHQVLRNFKMPGYTVPEFRREGGHHRRRRRVRPADPPRGRRDAGAEEVAHLRA